MHKLVACSLIILAITGCSRFKPVGYQVTTAPVTVQQGQVVEVVPAYRSYFSAVASTLSRRATPSRQWQLTGPRYSSRELKSRHKAGDAEDTRQ